MENYFLSGLIYRNPNPHISSRHAYFPSIAVLDNGEMVATFSIGEAFEAVNLDTYIVRSNDMGESWSSPFPLVPREAKTLISNCTRITAFPGKEIVAVVVESHRELHPQEGLANPVNLGFVPTDLLLFRSGDFGHTWMKPQKIVPPLIGPSFELCSPIIPLHDGRWLWPTSTWRGWDGYCPNGMKSVAFVSYDEGKTWPEYLEIMKDKNEKIIYWESKVIELTNKMLLSIAWAYDESERKDLPNQYTLSRDGGKTWISPHSTHIQGQTMAIAQIPDGRLLTVYRRMDMPGLWVTISRLENDCWNNEEEFCLWGKQEMTLQNKSGNMVQDFNELKFGAPCITILPDHSVYIAFWCYEEMVSNIRWCKLMIS